MKMSGERFQGKVKWFNGERGFGLITPDAGGEDIFVHHSSIRSQGFRSLVENEPVEFQIQQSDDGRIYGDALCFSCGAQGQSAKNCTRPPHGADRESRRLVRCNILEEMPRLQPRLYNLPAFSEISSRRRSL